MKKLHSRLLAALRRNSFLDMTTRNIARALKLNINKVRKALNEMRALGLVRGENVKGPGSVIVWSAAQ